MNKASLLTVLLLAITWAGQTGCMLAAPLMKPAADLIATRSNREHQLHETMTKFHKNLTWGNLSSVYGVAAPEAQESLMADFRNQGERKYVDVKVTNFLIHPDGDSATVDAVIRYFEQPTNIVQAEKRTEKWTFSRFSGWQLASYEKIGEKAETKSFGPIVP